MKIRILDHDYDQFVLGAGPSGEPTLVHLGAPQFICKIAPDIRAVPEDDYVHACADGRTLHCIAFLGEPVTTPEDFTALMAQAESVLKRIPK